MEARYREFDMEPEQMAKTITANRYEKRGSKAGTGVEE